MDFNYNIIIVVITLGLAIVAVVLTFLGLCKRCCCCRQRLNNVEGGVNETSYMLPTYPMAPFIN